MVLKKRDTGEAVEKLQRALLALGYPLPRWGADGDLGVETLGAFWLFLRDHGNEADTEPELITDREQELLYTVHAQLPEVIGPALADPTKFHDIRDSAKQTWVRGKRPWNRVTGITLHQTACVMGERPQRWGTLGAHIGITREGRVIWVHDFDKLCVHANNFNARTVGIEMDGTYEGVEGNERTFWRPKDEPNRRPQVPTAELIEAAKATVRWIRDEVARHGGRIELLVAHRQASVDRQSDPGSALWQRVALPLHEELGLSDGGAGYTVGDGLPIPEAWDPRRVGVKY